LGENVASRWSQPDPSADVVRLQGLSAAAAATAIARTPAAAGDRAVVVDTRGCDVVTLPLLAALVRMRRRLRCRGSDVVVVADTETSGLLRRSGLVRSLPVCDDLEAAVQTVSA
jgi:hypothetical protein